MASKAPAKKAAVKVKDVDARRDPKGGYQAKKQAG